MNKRLAESKEGLESRGNTAGVTGLTKNKQPPSPFFAIVHIASSVRSVSLGALGAWGAWTGWTSKKPPS